MTFDTNGIFVLIGDDGGEIIEVLKKKGWNPVVYPKVEKDEVIKLAENSTGTRKYHMATIRNKYYHANFNICQMEDRSKAMEWLAKADEGLKNRIRAIAIVLRGDYEDVINREEVAERTSKFADAVKMLIIKRRTGDKYERCVDRIEMVELDPDAETKDDHEEHKETYGLERICELLHTAQWPGREELPQTSKDKVQGKLSDEPQDRFRPIGNEDGVASTSKQAVAGAPVNSTSNGTPSCPAPGNWDLLGNNPTHATALQGFLGMNNSLLMIYNYVEHEVSDTMKKMLLKELARIKDVYSLKNPDFKPPCNSGDVHSCTTAKPKQKHKNQNAGTVTSTAEMGSSTSVTYCSSAQAVQPSSRTPTHKDVETHPHVLAYVHSTDDPQTDPRTAAAFKEACSSLSDVLVRITLAQASSTCRNQNRKPNFAVEVTTSTSSIDWEKPINNQIEEGISNEQLELWDAAQREANARDKPSSFNRQQFIDNLQKEDEEIDSTGVSGIIDAATAEALMDFSAIIGSVKELKDSIQKLPRDQRVNNARAVTAALMNSLDQKHEEEANEEEANEEEANEEEANEESADPGANNDDPSTE